MSSRIYTTDSGQKKFEIYCRRRGFKQCISRLFCKNYCRKSFLNILSHDVAAGSEITPCNKIDKPQVVYRFTGNVMTFITMTKL